MAYVRRTRPTPKKPHLVTDATRQKPFKPGGYPRNCLQCNTAYNYHPAAKDKGHEHKRGLFCSWDCRSAHINASKPGPHSKLHTGTCVTCQTVFVGARVRKYCSSDCWPRAQAAPAMDRVCRLCGTQYCAANTGGMHKQYCSEQCKNIVDSGYRRGQKAMRRARLKGAKVESVDPYVVFERDGWRCQLCGKETPVSKRGTHDSDAPELDHVMPLAKGGAHSYENTQCSCRKCNQEKGDKIVERKYYFSETFYL